MQPLNLGSLPFRSVSQVTKTAYGSPAFVKLGWGLAGELVRWAARTSKQKSACSGVAMEGDMPRKTKGLCDRPVHRATSRDTKLERCLRIECPGGESVEAVG